MKGVPRSLMLLLGPEKELGGPLTPIVSHSLAHTASLPTLRWFREQGAADWDRGASTGINFHSSTEVRGVL